MRRSKPSAEAIERARADARRRRVEMGLTATADGGSVENEKEIAVHALSDAAIDEIEEGAKLAKHAEESESPYPYHPGFLRVRPDSVLMLISEIRRQRKVKKASLEDQIKFAIENAERLLAEQGVQCVRRLGDQWVIETGEPRTVMADSIYEAFLRVRKQG